MNKRKPHVFTYEIMENTDFWGKILIFGFRILIGEGWGFITYS